MKTSLKSIPGNFNNICFANKKEFRQSFPKSTVKASLSMKNQRKTFPSEGGGGKIN